MFNLKFFRMKKKKFIGLSLRKKTISNLNNTKIVGGGYTDTCIGEGGDCGFGSNECQTDDCGGGGGPAITQKTCTCDTLQLSYCAGIPGVPDTCQSFQVCA